MKNVGLILASNTGLTLVSYREIQKNSDTLHPNKHGTSIKHILTFLNVMRYAFLRCSKRAFYKQ